MKKLTATFCLTIAVLLGSVGVSWSADFDKGRAAYKRGDYATALLELTPLAEQGNGDAALTLASMYWFGGKGVPVDKKAMIKWYRVAAEQGNIFALSALGMNYKDGEGVPKDNVYAHMWLSIAESLGHNMVAETRDGIARQMSPSQIKKAKDLARECKNKKYKGCVKVSESAEQGYADAQFELGLMYKHGAGVPKDNKEAMKWFKLAAEQGYSDAKLIIAAEKGDKNAAFSLAGMYSGTLGGGDDFPEDRGMARRYWKIAAEQGHSGAQRIMNISVPWWKPWELYGWWRFW